MRFVSFLYILIVSEEVKPALCPYDGGCWVAASCESLILLTAFVDPQRKTARSHVIYGNIMGNTEVQHQY